MKKLFKRIWGFIFVRRQKDEIKIPDESFHRHPSLLVGISPIQHWTYDHVGEQKSPRFENTKDKDEMPVIEF